MRRGIFAHGLDPRATIGSIEERNAQLLHAVPVQEGQHFAHERAGHGDGRVRVPWIA
jgi:hypothetical protein